MSKLSVFHLSVWNRFVLYINIFVCKFCREISIENVTPTHYIYVLSKENWTCHICTYYTSKKEEEEEEEEEEEGTTK